MKILFPPRFLGPSLRRPLGGPLRSTLLPMLWLLLALPGDLAVLLPVVLGLLLLLERLDLFLKLRDHGFGVPKLLFLILKLPEQLFDVRTFFSDRLV